MELQNVSPAVLRAQEKASRQLESHKKVLSDPKKIEDARRAIREQITKNERIPVASNQTKSTSAAVEKIRKIVQEAICLK